MGLGGCQLRAGLPLPYRGWSCCPVPKPWGLIAWLTASCGLPTGASTNRSPYGRSVDAVEVLATSLAP